MAQLFEDNARSIGVKIDSDPAVVSKYGGATDMGNVSRIVPSIHPKFYIGTQICNHNEGFTTASGNHIIIIWNRRDLEKGEGIVIIFTI